MRSLLKKRVVSEQEDDTKQGRLIRLYRNVGGSIVVSLMVQFTMLFSGVAAARILGVTDRGRSALLFMFAMILPLIGTFGVPLSVTYYIARAPAIGQRLMHSLRRTVVLQTGLLLVAHATVLYVAFDHATSSAQVSAAISLLATPPIVAWIYGLAVLQGVQEFRGLNFCRLVFAPLNTAVLVVMLIAGARGLPAVTAVWVGLYWVTASITVARARRALAVAAEQATDDDVVPDPRTVFRFGFKGLFGSITPLQGFQLDQAIVGLFISQAALGIYVVAVAFTNLPRFIAQSIGLVAYPHIASERQANRGWRRATVLFTAITVVLCGTVVVLTELALPFLVHKLFGAEFAAAVGVGRILLISGLIFSVKRVLSEAARGAGRPLVGTVSEAVALAGLAPAVLLFSGSGAKGVAMALVVTSAAGVITLVIGMLLPERGTASDAVTSEPHLSVGERLGVPVAVGAQADS